MRKIETKRWGYCLIVFFINMSCMAQAFAEDKSLADLGKQLNNPLTSIWSLVLQNNTIFYEGDRIEDTETGNVLNFQPALPVPIGDKWIWIGRPVIPYSYQPQLDPNSATGINGHVDGLGDIQVLNLFGPSKIDGWIWGIGPTLIFPTASDDKLGQEKYQAGPALMAVHMGKKLVYGVVFQQWWSFAGEDDRPDTSHASLQYIAWWQLPDAWQVGFGPTATYDWEADNDNALTLPVGVGVQKMVKIGKLPLKIKAELTYAVVSPDDFGEEWKFLLQFTSVIPSPFRK